MLKNYENYEIKTLITLFLQNINEANYLLLDYIFLNQVHVLLLIMTNSNNKNILSYLKIMLLLGILKILL